MKSIFKIAIIITILTSVGFVTITAKTPPQKRITINTDSIVPLKNRWAIRTNIIDWVALLPNIGVEFDLSKYLYKNWSVGLSAKGNWTTPSFFPNNVFYDLSTVRLEFKRYNRTRMPNRDINWLARIFTWQKVNPNLERTWFLGPYIDFSKYNMKFSKTGHKGLAVGSGMTFGFGRSVYAYKNGVLDLELSASLGVVYTQFDSYTLNNKNNSYEYVEKGMSKFLPYPIISDIRLAFVYRFSTIKGKYKENSTIKSRFKELSRKIDAKRDSVRQIKRQHQIEDSLEHVAAQQAKDAEKIQKDSLNVKSGKASKRSKLIGKKKKDSAVSENMQPIGESRLVNETNNSTQVEADLTKEVKSTYKNSESKANKKDKSKKKRSKEDNDVVKENDTIVDKDEKADKKKSSRKKLKKKSLDIGKQSIDDNNDKEEK